ncbi:hypothetical protein [Shimazuella kribbensis]|uniref:hypothetical protein n=1 Tax=Shimazuella kribbensis TaxID=139808 RepID=UPI0004147A8F|nr:hypothetical protein [Shimazuella kribbensis]
MTPEQIRSVKAILSLMRSAELLLKYNAPARDLGRFIDDEIKPPFEKEWDSLRTLEDEELKNALRATSDRFAKAQYHLNGIEAEEGLDLYKRALQALHAATQRAKKLNISVESQ